MSYSSLIITFLLDSLHKVQKKLRKKNKVQLGVNPWNHLPILSNFWSTCLHFPSLHFYYLLLSPFPFSFCPVSSRFLVSLLLSSNPIISCHLFTSHFFPSLHFLSLHFLSLLCYVQYGHLLYTLYALLIIASLFVELPTVLKVQLL